VATLRSDRTINKIVSQQPEVKEAVSEAALKIAVKAERKLQLHRDTGAARIEVEFGRTDAYVFLVDEAAVSIEFGHWVKGKFETSEPKYVPGLYVISEAAGLI
jgi:hypothetical protein